ncbi:MAG: HNH endonuclease signature motif containing protein [Corynebacterium sp.]|uniref:HNH endonuclease signature motif containing protein n=1 Tax=Corynebacterium sp. TaxID=1720 RepID=UPI003F021BED
MTRTLRRSEQYCRPKQPIIIPDRVAKRAGTSYVEDENGCWISTYSVGSHGYAQIGWHAEGGRRLGTTAHRASWVYANDGQIPDGMTIDHTCKVRRCVNPAHLRLLPNFENARRTAGRDWPSGQCVHGHPNSELTLKGGKWVCRSCNAEWQRRYREKKRTRPT